jgi:hypothetical protein
MVRREREEGREGEGRREEKRGDEGEREEGEEEREGYCVRDAASQHNNKSASASSRNARRSTLELMYSFPSSSLFLSATYTITFIHNTFKLALSSSLQRVMPIPKSMQIRKGHF